MANICNYEIRVIGTKNAGLVIFASMPGSDFKEITHQSGSGTKYQTYFTGDCKWSVNHSVTDAWTYGQVDLTGKSENEIKAMGPDFRKWSLRARSEAFSCAIQVHYWSEESGFDQYDSYKNGQCIKQRKIAYAANNKFDWYTEEFVGHVGEYDETVDGEESDMDFMRMLMSLNGAGMQVTMAEPMRGQKLPAQPKAVSNSPKDPIYHWTFEKGETAKYGKLVIPVPDGLVTSPEIMQENDCDFAIIHPEIKNDYPAVKIYSSHEEKVYDHEGLRAICHPYAIRATNKMLAVKVSATLSQRMSMQLSSIGASMQPAFSYGSEFVMAYAIRNILPFKSDAAGYNVHLNTISNSYGMTVYAHEITENQRLQLEESLVDWVERIDVMNQPPKKAPVPLIDSPACMRELKSGKISGTFAKAKEQATVDYNTTINAQLQTLEQMEEDGTLPDNWQHELRQALTQGLKVRQFYLEKFDAVISKLIDEKIDPLFLKSVYEALKELSDIKNLVLDYSLLGQTVKVHVPNEIKDISQKWATDLSLIKDIKQTFVQKKNSKDAAAQAIQTAHRSAEEEERYQQYTEQIRASEEKRAEEKARRAEEEERKRQEKARIAAAKKAAEEDRKREEDLKIQSLEKTYKRKKAAVEAEHLNLDSAEKKLKTATNSFQDKEKALQIALQEKRALEQAPTGQQASRKVWLRAITFLAIGLACLGAGIASLSSIFVTSALICGTIGIGILSGNKDKLNGTVLENSRIANIKNLDAQIEANQNEASRLLAQVKAAETALKEMMKKCSAAEKELQLFEKNNPDVLLIGKRKALEKLNSRRSSGTTPTQIANQAIQCEIVRCMESGRKYTVSNIIAEFPACNGMATQKVSLLVQDLVSLKILHQTEANGRRYYQFIEE